jgi:nitroimidazol reductase NimA-like FMN-containing flavoprotein (pyridoxamine 5'-phosphate oxidase superfamily)
MARRNEPEIRDLSKAEVEDLLRRNNVGRLAFIRGRSVDIRPVHYAWTRKWLFGRTSPGEKLRILDSYRWVAFEIDEVDGPLDWRSVIVRGTFYALEPEGSVHDRRLYNRALRNIRKHAPASLTPDDPVAFRSILFGISIDSVTGRSATTRRKPPRRKRP